jgi:subtilisin family serine protease
MTALSAVGAHLTGKIDQLDLAQVSMRPSALPQLLSSPGIEWAERESVSHTLGKPNDPLISEQWAPQKIGVFNAWRTEKGTKSTIVAVVDTGVDPSHPDLQNRLLPGYDFVNADQDPSDDHGHGTHVAGIIAARPDNRTGISGMSWGARILPLKACDSQGACGNFEVTAAIVRAIQEKAQVVNLSLGAPGESCPREFDLAAQLAQRQNVLLVAAAGNSAQEGNPTSYPAACDGYVAVGATSPTDEWATFSEHGDYVDVAAPGVMILSTVPPALLMQDDPSTPGYGFADGTSMATPHVAGLAALLFSQHPDWQPSHVQHRIESTAVDLGARGRDPYFGAGRIDVRRAVGRR